MGAREQALFRRNLWRPRAIGMCTLIEGGVLEDEGDGFYKVGYCIAPFRFYSNRCGDGEWVLTPSVTKVVRTGSRFLE